MRLKLLPAAKHFHREVPEQQAEVCVIPHHYVSSGPLAIPPRNVQPLEPPPVLSCPPKIRIFGDADNKAKLQIPKSFISAQYWSFYWQVLSDHCNNIYCPSHKHTARNTTDKMHTATLPECFHHGNPPGNSPAAHLHCQFFQHIHPLSKSWQLWHLAHPGNPGSHTEWQWCSHTWFVRVQLDHWGELNLFHSISAHIILQRILHWSHVLYFYKSSISFNYFFPSQSWALSSHRVSAV